MLTPTMCVCVCVCVCVCECVSLFTEAKRCADRFSLDILIFPFGMYGLYISTLLWFVQQIFCCVFPEELLIRTCNVFSPNEFKIFSGLVAKWCGPLFLCARCDFMTTSELIGGNLGQKRKRRADCSVQYFSIIWSIDVNFCLSQQTKGHSLEVGSVRVAWFKGSRFLAN